MLAQIRRTRLISPALKGGALRRIGVNEKSPPCAANLGGGISANNGGDRSTVPFCISILTSVRRIVKIAVRFSHTKTALCDRKDTQSHFVVNAARSIVCVGTNDLEGDERKQYTVSMPHAALCVSGHYSHI